MAVTDIPHPELYTDYYQLTMGQGYYKIGIHEKKAHFDYFFRNTPFGGGFVVFAGLADLLAVLEGYRFTPDACRWLENKGFDHDFCRFLGEYRFDADIHSVREGEPVLPGEPVLTVSGSLLSCQLIETLLLNILNFQSLIATKAYRLRQACGDRQLVDFGLRRGQGAGSVSATRAAFIGGITATSNVMAGYRFDVPVSGTMAHSWIQCFDSELEAFRAYAALYPDQCILLVDTYNSLESGIPNAITVAKELEGRGHRLIGVRLDSGEPHKMAPKARKMLDDAGLNNVAIAVSDQLDEEKIAALVGDNVPIDLFGVGTRLITGHPDGALSGVYKMCELDGRPTMKYTDESSKSSLPGVKELLRYADSQGRFTNDLICLSGESPDSPGGEPLRRIFMESGHALNMETDLEKMAEYCRTRSGQFPDRIRRMLNPDRFPVELDRSLKSLIEKLKR
ncbi:nicotinate phosphoribosyltransferase [Balneolales bacterium ANBcel1]|nr:nicotinate phosphoribosyltransferase [Balneolales bacterium ANBcel1]